MALGHLGYPRNIVFTCASVALASLWGPLNASHRDARGARIRIYIHTYTYVYIDQRLICRYVIIFVIMSARPGGTTANGVIAPSTKRYQVRRYARGTKAPEYRAALHAAKMYLFRLLFIGREDQLLRGARRRCAGSYLSLLFLSFFLLVHLLLGEFLRQRRIQRGDRDGTGRKENERPRRADSQVFFRPRESRVISRSLLLTLAFSNPIDPKLAFIINGGRRAVRTRRLIEISRIETGSGRRAA